MAIKKDDDNTGAVGGNEANVVALEDAERKLRRRKPADDPPPHMPRNGVKPQLWPGAPPNWSENSLGLPKEAPCPVEILGVEGSIIHLIDSDRQFRSMDDSEFTHSGIQGLFKAMPHYPEWAWPRFGRAPADKAGKPQPPPIKSFEDDHVRKALFRAASRKGLFAPADKLRGRGAWMMPGGQLVYHSGEELWTYEDHKFKQLDIGVHQGHLYPRLANMPAPWTVPITANHLRATVGALLNTFRRWNFERPKVDPVLLLGWCGVAYLGGALDWRSAVLLLGGFGTGKSTLQTGLQALLGDHLMASADTTGPAIAQSLKQDTRAVAVDELEAEADTRKVDAVVALMRSASSGAFRRRGSSDQRAVETHLRSAFLFSAINNPIQRPQDLSRVAILRLRELDLNQPRPDPIDADTWGRIVLARLMTEFHRFEETRNEYKKALGAGKHIARGADTYGTLLACADLLLGAELAAELDVPLTEDLKFWSEELASNKLPETEDARPNWAMCINHVMTCQLPNWRQGKRPSVAQIMAAVHGCLVNDPTVVEAKKELADAGLGLLAPGENDRIAPAGLGWILAVPNVHPVVTKLFEGTQWAGSAGAGGPWKDALRQAPPDVVLTDRHTKLRIGGWRSRCSYVVVRNAEPPEEEPED